MKSSLQSLLIGLFLFSGSVFAKQVIINNDPIEVKLPIEQEIRVEFPETIVDLNIPAEVDEKLETFLKPNGTIYWKANAKIDTGRVIATTATGEVVLLDLRPSAKLAKEDTVLQLVSEQTLAQINNANASINTNSSTSKLPKFLAEQMADNNSNKNLEANEDKKMSYADLVQFAMQHYTGPERLIEPISVAKIEARAPSKSTRFIRVWYDRLTFKVNDAWLYQDLYITALKVKNISNQPYSFDPKAIRGDFKFVAALNAIIEPIGSYQDETIWVFISERPFEKAAGGQ